MYMRAMYDGAVTHNTRPGTVHNRTRKVYDRTIVVFNQRARTM